MKIVEITIMEFDLTTKQKTCFPNPTMVELEWLCVGRIQVSVFSKRWEKKKKHFQSNTKSSY